MNQNQEFENILNGNTHYSDVKDVDGFIDYLYDNNLLLEREKMETLYLNNDLRYYRIVMFLCNHASKSKKLINAIRKHIPFKWISRLDCVPKKDLDLYYDKYDISLVCRHSDLSKDIIWKIKDKIYYSNNETVKWMLGDKLK